MENKNYDIEELKKTINENIFEVIKLLEINKLPEAQVYLLSYRQQLVDLLYDINNKLNYLNNEYYRLYVQNIKKYYDYEYRLSDKHKELFAENDCMEYKVKQEKLIILKEYLNHSIKTLDNIFWAIKHKLEILQLN